MGAPEEEGMKKVILTLVVAFCLIWMVGNALAQSTDTANLTINAAVNSRAKLTLGTNTINFPDADPDTTPSIAASENPVSVNVKARTGSASTVTLTHRAAGDLDSGTDTIAITNVTWTATGTGFVAGTMSTGSDVSAGSWTGSTNESGTFSYSLANSWSYAPGSYTASSTYTLTAP